MPKSFLVYQPMYQLARRYKSINLEELAKLSSNWKPKSIINSGGGCRGRAFVGAYDALDESGILKDVQSISGSSIGGLFASFIAAGMPIKTLKEITINQDFKALFGDRVSYFGFERDGNPMEDFVRYNTSKSIVDYFKNNSIDANALNEVDFLKLEKVRSDAFSYQGITYEGLAFLRKLDPEKFKDLTLTAVNKSTGEVKYFNALTTPHLYIHATGRASGSIPGLLEPTLIDGEEYIDGGYYENIPTEAENEILKKSSQVPLDDKFHNELRQGRLVFAFNEEDSDDPVHKALHTEEEKLYNPSWPLSFLLDHVLSWYAGISSEKKCTEEAEKNYKTLQKHYSLQTVQLKTGIQSTDFRGDQRKKYILMYEGYFSTKDYLINHGLADSDPLYEFRKFTFHLIKNYLKQPVWSLLFGYDVYDFSKSKVLIDYLISLDNCYDSNLTVLVDELIQKCLHNVKLNEQALNTRSLSVLLDTLNGVHVNESVKWAFMHVLLDIDYHDNIMEFQFELTHFKDYLNSQQQQKMPDPLFCKQEENHINQKLTHRISF
ncbi:patatin-like phospholipase family protein [Thiotrichales bacterium 19S9-12]|nr:patatin-like phospholipase family protein [Thiotrichales bacterium 19S9-11]MCF6812082.1 patatin-like phospholipase family protein [Thiotrichales bacterium 19S9-12]